MDVGEHHAFERPDVERGPGRRRALAEDLADRVRAVDEQPAPLALDRDARGVVERGERVAHAERNEPEPHSSHLRAPSDQNPGAARSEIGGDAARREGYDPAVPARKGPRLAATLAVPAVVALAVLARSQPTPPRPADAPAREFSAERALATVRELAGDGVAAPGRLGGRPPRGGRARGAAAGARPGAVGPAGVRLRGPRRLRARPERLRPARAPGPRARARSSSSRTTTRSAPGPAPPTTSPASPRRSRSPARCGRDPRPPRPVLLLLTDGEEAALVGVSAFLDRHPAAREVGAVVNLEARGTTGPSILFDTSGAPPWLGRALSALPRPVTTSVASAVYDLLPNDTDLTAFERAAVPGVNLAFAFGAVRYHTPRDDLAHLDPASLQHQGESALALVRALAAEDLERGAARPRAWFDVLSLGVVSWPWPREVALAAALAALLAAAASVRREAHPARAAAYGLAAAALAPARRGGGDGAPRPRAAGDGRAPAPLRRAPAAAPGRRLGRGPRRCAPRAGPARPARGAPGAPRRRRAGLRGALDGARAPPAARDPARGGPGARARGRRGAPRERRRRGDARRGSPTRSRPAPRRSSSPPSRSSSRRRWERRPPSRRRRSSPSSSRSRRAPAPTPRRPAAPPRPRRARRGGAPRGGAGGAPARDGVEPRARSRSPSTRQPGRPAGSPRPSTTRLPPGVRAAARFSGARAAPFPWTPTRRAFSAPAATIALAPPRVEVLSTVARAGSRRVRARLSSPRGAPVVALFLPPGARLGAVSLEGLLLPEPPPLARWFWGGHRLVACLTTPARGVTVELTVMGTIPWTSSSRTGRRGSPRRARRSSPRGHRARWPRGTAT